MSSGLCFTFSLPVHFNTMHNLDSTTLLKMTLHTEHLFQNVNGRQPAKMNRSRTSNTSVAETRVTRLTQVMSPKSLQQFLEDIYHLYVVQKEFGEQDQQAPFIEERIRKNWDTMLTRSQRFHLLRRCPTSSPRCTSTSIWKALRTLISKMESYKSC